MENVSLNRGNNIMRIKTYIILFIMFFPIVCLAQDLKPYSCRVSLYVSAKNDSFKGKIESYISRELRSLGDVTVTDDKPDWVLYILALETYIKGEQKAGVILSTTVLKPFNNKLLLNMVNEKFKEVVSKSTSGILEHRDNWLQIGSPSNLRSICNEIVADFDSQWIKPEREHRQKEIDSQLKEIDSQLKELINKKK
jgi:hypothetical protein